MPLSLALGGLKGSSPTNVLYIYIYSDPHSNDIYPALLRGRGAFLNLFKLDNGELMSFSFSRLASIHRLESDGSVATIIQEKKA